MVYTTIRTQISGPVARVSLNRPEVRNAFNQTVIAEMTDFFAELAANGDLRAVVLDGEGTSFCAGADLEWMQRMSGYTFDENRDDAVRMSSMFEAIDSAPIPVIAKVHGAVLGGGCGLVSCADIVVASESCVFGLTEVKLGIIPAVISPFVVSKIGGSHARALFMTGERFSAARAAAIGLAHHVVAESELGSAVERLVGELLTSGPVAAREAKRWVAMVVQMTKVEASAHAVQKIAQLRASPEGREGITAFLEKRKPGWITT